MSLSSFTESISSVFTFSTVVYTFATLHLHENVAQTSTFSDQVALGENTFFIQPLNPDDFYSPRNDNFEISARVQFSYNGATGEGVIIQDFLDGNYLVNITSCNNWSVFPAGEYNIIMPYADLTLISPNSW